MAKCWFRNIPGSTSTSRDKRKSARCRIFASKTVVPPSVLETSSLFSRKSLAAERFSSAKSDCRHSTHDRHANSSFCDDTSEFGVTRGRLIESACSPLRILGSCTRTFRSRSKREKLSAPRSNRKTKRLPFLDTISRSISSCSFGRRVKIDQGVENTSREQIQQDSPLFYGGQLLKGIAPLSKPKVSPLNVKGSLARTPHSPGTSANFGHQVERMVLSRVGVGTSSGTHSSERLGQHPTTSVGARDRNLSTHSQVYDTVRTLSPDIYGELDNLRWSQPNSSSGAESAFVESGIATPFQEEVTPRFDVSPGTSPNTSFFSLSRKAPLTRLRKAKPPLPRPNSVMSASSSRVNTVSFPSTGDQWPQDQRQCHIVPKTILNSILSSEYGAPGGGSTAALRKAAISLTRGASVYRSPRHGDFRSRQAGVSGRFIKKISNPQVFHLHGVSIPPVPSYRAKGCLNATSNLAFLDLAIPPTHTRDPVFASSLRLPAMSWPAIPDQLNRSATRSSFTGRRQSSVDGGVKATARVVSCQGSKNFTGGFAVLHPADRHLGENPGLYCHPGTSASPVIGHNTLTDFIAVGRPFLSEGVGKTFGSTIYGQAQPGNGQDMIDDCNEDTKKTRRASISTFGSLARDYNSP